MTPGAPRGPLGRAWSASRPPAAVAGPDRLLAGQAAGDSPPPEGAGARAPARRAPARRRVSRNRARRAPRMPGTHVPGAVLPGVTRQDAGRDGCGPKEILDPITRK